MPVLDEYVKPNIRSR